MPQPLPSSDSARDLVAGEQGAALRVLAHTAGRAVLMGTGMLLARVPLKTTVRAAVAGSVAIELFALFWFAAQKK